MCKIETQKWSEVCVGRNIMGLKSNKDLGRSRSGNDENNQN